MLIGILILLFGGPRWNSARVALFVCFAGASVRLLLPLTRRYRRGVAGERFALTFLEQLPDAYTVVSGLSLPGIRHGDIDLLIIGAMGLVVIEVKTYRGVLLYENGQWFRVGRNGSRFPLPSFSMQVRDNVRHLTTHFLRLRANSTVLSTAFVPILPMLVFVDTEHLNTVGLDIPAFPATLAPNYLMSLPLRLRPAQVEALIILYSRR